MAADTLINAFNLGVNKALSMFRTFDQPDQDEDIEKLKLKSRKQAATSSDQEVQAMAKGYLVAADCYSNAKEKAYKIWALHDPHLSRQLNEDIKILAIQTYRTMFDVCNQQEIPQIRNKFLILLAQKTFKLTFNQATFSHSSR